MGVGNGSYKRRDIMDYIEEMEQKWKNTEEGYLDDINTCMIVLKMLKKNYTTPGASGKINSDRVKRARITIHEILNEW